MACGRFWMPGGFSRMDLDIFQDAIEFPDDNFWGDSCWYFQNLKCSPGPGGQYPRYLNIDEMFRPRRKIPKLSC